MLLFALDSKSFTLSVKAFSAEPTLFAKGDFAVKFCFTFSSSVITFVKVTSFVGLFGSFNAFAQFRVQNQSHSFLKLCSQVSWFSFGKCTDFTNPFEVYSFFPVNFSS